MREEVKDLWVKALRSGEYQQTTSVLHNATANSYCCLGVLCDLYTKVDPQFPTSRHYNVWVDSCPDDEDCVDDQVEISVTTYDGNNETLPLAVMLWSGIKTPSGYFGHLECLTSLNDDHGYSFDDIADVIEEHWKNL